MKGMQRIIVEIRESTVEMQKNAGNQGGDAGNQIENLGIAVEMKKKSTGNDKLKEWREVKIIEKKHLIWCFSC